MAEPVMEREETFSHVVQMMTEAETFNDYLSTGRQRALDYYDNKTPDLVPKPGQSSQVSGETRKHYGKLRPSIMRTLFGGGGIAEYEPLGPDSEQMAIDASDYVNRVVLPECNGEEEILNAVFDAIILRTGILKWGVMVEQDRELERFYGQPADAVEALIEQEGNDLVEVDQNPDGSFDGLVEITTSRAKPYIRAVRRSSFLIHPHSVNIYDNKCVGEYEYWTRSDLVAMGIDRAIVDSLRAAEVREDPIKDTYGQYDFHNAFDRSSIADGYSPMEEIQVRNLYVRLDLDNDGIAELHNVMLAEGAGTGDHDGITAEAETGTGYVLIHMERADKAPYAKVVIENRPFNFEGHSLAEDLMEIQKVKTQIVRDTLDNTYQVGNPRTFLKAESVENEEDLIAGDSSVPIFVKTSAEMRDAIHTVVVPSIAASTLPILEYMDVEAADRTGVNDLSGGVDPEKFQDMSATGASIVSAAGQERAEMYIRTLAQGGIRDALGGLLKMVVRYASAPRDVRVAGNWRKFEPESWDWRMKAVVNVGGGTGSRSADLQALTLISQLQDAIVTRYGLFNPLVTPVEMANTSRRIVQIAGVEDASRYIRSPTDDELEAFAEQLSEQQAEDPDAGKEDRKAQLQMAEQQFKAAMAQFDRETELMLADKKMAVQANREVAQLQADTQIRVTEAELRAAEDARQAERQRRLDEWQQHIEALRLSMEDDHHDDEMALKRDQLAAQRTI